MKRIITINSAYDGAGKTFCAVNLAAALSREGRRVLLLDGATAADRMDLSAPDGERLSFNHGLSYERRAGQAGVAGAEVWTLQGLAAAGGVSALNKGEKLSLLSTIEEDGDGFDAVIVEAGSGVSEALFFYNSIAHERIIVAAPGRSSVKSTYSLMKALTMKCRASRFDLIVNRAVTEEAHKTFKSLSLLSGNFLKASVNFLGSVPVGPHGSSTETGALFSGMACELLGG